MLLTFVGFFMFELIKQLPIHPIQYGLVGLALAIFFLLLVSLSEHIEFGVAYLVSSVACIGLLGIYLSAVLRSVARGIGFAAMLAMLYAALYGLLVSEDNALVLGAGPAVRDPRGDHADHAQGRLVPAGPIRALSCVRAMAPESANFVGQCGRGPEAGADGGEGGIRTHGGIATTAVFKTAALNHSATSPGRAILADGAGHSTCGGRARRLRSPGGNTNRGDKDDHPRFRGR